MSPRRAGGVPASGYDGAMPRAVQPALRIALLVAATLACAWAVLRYLDVRTLQQRNADIVALCATLAPGMPAAEAERRARAAGAIVARTMDGRLVVKIPGQRVCVAETAGGVLRSAAVARGD